MPLLARWVEVEAEVGVMAQMDVLRPTRCGRRAAGVSAMLQDVRASVT